MSNLREAAQLAVEVLRQWVIPRAGVGTVHYKKALELLRAAIAKPDDKAQPLGWMRPDELQKAKTAPYLCRVHPEKDKHADMIPVYIVPQPPAEQSVTLGGGFPGDHNGTKAALREDALERLWNAHWNALKSMSDEDINKLDEHGTELSDEQIDTIWNATHWIGTVEFQRGFARAIIAADRAARGGAV